MGSDVVLVMGYIIAEFSFLVMALLAICIGSYESVKYIKSLKEKEEPPQIPPLTIKEAWKFVMKSGLCLSFLYLQVKLAQIAKEERGADTNSENIECITLILFLGLTSCLSELLRPLISFLISPVLRDIPYQLCFKKGKGDEEKYLIDKHFTMHDIINYLCCALLGLCYLMTKNWIINNVLGIAAAIFAIKYLHVNKMMTGCIFLILMLIYDVFFVFGTEFMLTVATFSDIPAKLMFPVDIIKKGLSGGKFRILGVGDIAIPGTMIAFLLRFDLSLERNSWFYFYTSITSYSFGFLVTTAVLYVTQSGQPALLYLVPCILTPPLVLAIYRGDSAKLFKFEDHPDVEEVKEKGEGENPAESSNSLLLSKDNADTIKKNK